MRKTKETEIIDTYCDSEVNSKHLCLGSRQLLTPRYFQTMKDCLQTAVLWTSFDRLPCVLCTTADKEKPFILLWSCGYLKKKKKKSEAIKFTFASWLLIPAQLNVSILLNQCVNDLCTQHSKTGVLWLLQCVRAASLSPINHIQPWELWTSHIWYMEYCTLKCSFKSTASALAWTQHSKLND